MNRSAYIPLHGDVFNNRKTIEAANSLTNGSVERVVGHLARLWTWAIERNDDGDLSHLTDQMIADAAGWRGRPSRFVEGITRAGFLEPDRRIHDWDDFAGRLVDKRAHDRNRKRREREEAKTSGTYPPSSGGRPKDSPRDVRTQPTGPNRNGTERNEDADANESGQVSGASPSGGTTARRVRGSRLSDKQLLEATSRLAAKPSIGRWDPNDTRDVWSTPLANDQDPASAGDLNEALEFP